MCARAMHVSQTNRLFSQLALSPSQTAIRCAEIEAESGVDYVQVLKEYNLNASEKY